MSIDELPAEWQRVIKRLRKENAGFRVRCRTAEAEVARLCNLDSCMATLERPNV
ncbi:hypothetical protein AB0M34_09530 [Nocardia sp. NPDC050193]